MAASSNDCFGMCSYIFAIVKKFEPLLLLPIAFGVLLANLPLTGIMSPPSKNSTEPGGLLYYLYMGVKLGIYPSLIFLGIGAMTDFGPLIARPSSLFLGAAAQLGVAIAFVIATALGFSPAAGSFNWYYWRSRWTNCNIFNNKTCSRIIASNSDCSLFLYGSYTSYTTTYNETSYY